MHRWLTTLRDQFRGAAGGRARPHRGGEKLSRNLKLGASLLVLGVLLACVGTASAGVKSDSAKSETVGGVDPQFLSGARTIAHFTFQYTDPSNGTTYPITMVGADPRKGNTATTIHTVIIPLKIHFSAAGQ